MPAEGLAFLISAIIEVLLFDKLDWIFSLKSMKELFLSIISFKEFKLVDFFKISIFAIFFFIIYSRILLGILYFF